MHTFHVIIERESEELLMSAVEKREDEERGKQYRVTVSFSPDLYKRILQVAELFGLPEAAAVRYLAMRGLEGTMALIASTQSAQAVHGMFSMFEQEMELERKKSGSKADIRDVSAFSQVTVTPDWSDRNDTKGKKEGKKEGKEKRSKA